MGNKDGIEKNIQVVKDEFKTWKSEMAIHLDTFSNATGIKEKSHKAMNLVTESVRLLPRIIAYSIVLGLMTLLVMSIFLLFN